MFPRCTRRVLKPTGEAHKREKGALCVTQKVKSGSPAEVSHVLEGDVIVAVNGQDIGELPIAEVRRRMHESCGDQLVVTVLSSSAFRLLESRRDWDQILKAAGQDTLQLRAIKTACGGSGNYGFKTFEAKAWNEQRKALVHCHVIQKVGDFQWTTRVYRTPLHAPNKAGCVFRSVTRNQKRINCCWFT
ncbi:hypothetical protein HPB49_005338 [Dermacentor silvarum]|uniref:Uncharacterized protein n=1 Tax=Dermacentor silvarum TaxID=543639 RepID=A0ACB8DMS1_DERSI|nr:hypothetical protein HPB49_005338 [Dermacentor silvarum]